MTMSRYPRAVEADASYTINGVTYSSQRYKTLVREDNPEQEFNSVSLEYKVVQHDDVVTAVEKALEDLKLTHKGEPEVFNEGARIHVHKRFPQITMQVEGEYYGLSIDFDNSYDSTTGLRIEVGAYKVDTGIAFFVRESFSSHYHKHTKGLSIDALEKAVKKGIETFQTTVMKEFEAMVGAPIDPVAAAQRFLEMKKDAKPKIPQKYLEPVINAVITGVPRSMWKLYKIVMVEMGKFDLSIDRRRQIMSVFIKEVKGMKGRVAKPITTTPESDGQQSLPLNAGAPAA